MLNSRVITYYFPIPPHFILVVLCVTNEIAFDLSLFGVFLFLTVLVFPFFFFLVSKVFALLISKLEQSDFLFEFLMLVKDHSQFLHCYC